MDCPICGWRMTERKQWSAGGYALGLFNCSPCECEVSIKAPIANVSLPLEVKPKEKSKSKK